MRIDKPANLKVVGIGAAVILAGLLLATQGAQRLRVSASSERTVSEHLSAAPSCDPGVRQCVAEEDGRKVALSFGSRVSALKPFSVEVNLLGLVAEAVEIEFRMDGMHMGMLPVSLRPDGANRWRGTAVLPVCWQGRRRWTARVLLRDGDRGTRASFAFRAVTQ